MPLMINTNVSSLTAQRHLGVNTGMLSKTMERLASGYRINRAGDDAAGLQLSESLRSQIRGSEKALANTQDGINVLNIADGAFQTITDNLQRVRELLVQASNDTYNATQRGAIAIEVAALLDDIDRIARSTSFNGVPLLDGSIAATGFVLQVGANADFPIPPTPINEIDIVSAFSDMTSAGAALSGISSYVPGPPGAFTIADHAEAVQNLSEVDAAIGIVNALRGTLGAFVNRLEGTANNLSIGIENLSSSEARIRNVDVAMESANLTRNQILQQASSTILAQANQSPQLALQLLKGG